MGEKREARREQIASAGARLFAEKGYERTSLQEVADLLGLTKPALYYYYKSKEQLLFEIISSVMDQVLSDIGEIAERDMNPYAKLREMIGRYVQFFSKHPYEHAIMTTEVSSLGADLRGVIRDRQRLYLGHVRKILAELIAPEKQLDETSAAFALLGSMNWLFKWYDPRGPIAPERLADEFARIYAYGLLTADR